MSRRVRQPFPGIRSLALAGAILGIQSFCLVAWADEHHFSSLPVRVELQDFSIDTPREDAGDQAEPEDFDTALNAFSIGDYDRAIALLTRLAEANYVPAQAVLGYSYATGSGVARDDAKAVAWLITAAEQGDADAQTNLGYMYAHGRGVRRDLTQALKWYLQAAAQGNLIAQQNLATFTNRTTRARKPVQYGLAVVFDRAHEGDADAMRLLGEYYLYGVGMRVNLEQAQFWLGRAARAGSAAGQYRWGSLLASGYNDIEPDYLRGLSWIQRAAKRGYRLAQQWLAEHGQPPVEPAPSPKVTDRPLAETASPARKHELSAANRL